MCFWNVKASFAYFWRSTIPLTHPNWKTLLSSLGLCAVVHDYTESQSTPRAILHWALDSVLTHGICLLSHEGKFVFPKEFQTPQSRHSDASRWLDQTRFSRKDQVSLQLSKKPFSFLASLFNIGACSNMVAGLVIFPRPRGPGQTGLNHFAIESKT